MTRFFSAAVSLVALAAWLVAANHCALASVLPAPAEAASEHSHCGSSDEAPAEQERGGECDGSKCCKSLSAPTPGFAKSLVSCDAALLLASDYVGTDFRSPGTLHEAPLCELDTGPPVLPSFAELVLQRSLLAHAPPSLV